jgi:hypothetical protein
MVWAVIGFALQALLWKRKMARKEAMSEEDKKLQDTQGVVGDARRDFRYVSVDGRALILLDFTTSLGLVINVITFRLF